MRVYLIVFAFLFSAYAEAQPSSNVLDGIYIRENALGRRPIPYNYESEAGLTWSKRIWRVIDLREKINHPFYYPVEPYNGMRNLITVVRDGVCSGELTAYDPMSDEFIYTYRNEEACAIGEGVDTLFIPDEFDNIIPQIVKYDFQTENVLRFRIKEDWYFNRHRSVMEARIIGFCPVEEVKDENGEYKGERPLYWVYLPEIRHVLADQETGNRHNDVERRTYDDLLHKRIFSSYVYKESNPSGRGISEYKTGLEALLEGRKIEKGIFDYEQDLWEY